MFMKNLMIKISTMLAMVAVFTLVFGVSSCKKDDETTVPPVVVLDGTYVVGSVIAYSGFNVNATMNPTYNEVQNDLVPRPIRPQLMELYIPIKAGAAGFTIITVAGSVQTTYRPGTNFAVVATPTKDEPNVPFQRGSVVTTGTTVFTVPTDGMYHVVIDFGVMTAAIMPVHWGMIGAATPDGWGTSTVMTESAFNLTSMSWTISNMELRGGDWKFRYSNGWKVELDTTLDIGGGLKGVKVNTNLGGLTAAEPLPDTLVPGGKNYVNVTPGVYTCTLSYALGAWYVAVLTKTGDLPLTNWTGVKCDAVGEGIAAPPANPTAIKDPSTWNWGYQLVGDNAGIPTVSGDKYTWTWTAVSLVADKGFKVRTYNGVAPPSGGANFDAGFSALDVAASSANIVDMGGNLSTNLAGSYTITLIIDAANQDGKKIIITKN
jgi:hypothetical protein